MEAEALKVRQVAALHEEQRDREIETHSRFQVQMEVQRQFMLSPTTTPAYSTSNARNQSVFPLQELRVPNTYQLGSHMDQRGTPSGTNPLNAMFVNSEDPMTDIITILAAPMTDIIVTMAASMTDIFVDAVDPRTDILASEASPITVKNLLRP
jgi:hypothetical protein